MQSERQPADATAPNDTRTRVKSVRRLGQVTQLTPEQRDRLGPVEARYVFRANDYYLGLIDWDDPEDPIRQLIIPREEELSEWGTLDASNEESDAPRRTDPTGPRECGPHRASTPCRPRRPLHLAAAGAAVDGPRGFSPPDAVGSPARRKTLL